MATRRDSRTKINQLLSADSVVVDPQVANATPPTHNMTSNTGTAVNIINNGVNDLNSLNQLQLDEQLKQQQFQQQQLQQQLQQQQEALLTQHANGGDPSVVHQNIQIHQFLPTGSEMIKLPKTRKSMVNTDEDGVRKCSRCRVKRFTESPEQLQKYATCNNCRTKRKVVKNPIDASQPNTYLDYSEFVSKIKMNSSMDILEHRYKGYSDANVFKRYELSDEVDNATYQEVGKMIIDAFIHPLMEETGFRFPVRDYHKGGTKNKKLTFMFICSQDSDRQRKSKTSAGRTSTNKLKTEHCDSKITLSYSLTNGLVQIMYHHKSHAPYVWKRHSALKAHPMDLTSVSMDSNLTASGANNADLIHAVQLHELRHAQLLQQQHHNNNQSHIQLPPLQSISADALPLQGGALNPHSQLQSQQDHRDLLSEVQNLQTYNTTINANNVSGNASATTTPTNAVNVMDGLPQSYTHQQQQQQQPPNSQQYQYLRQSSNHPNSDIAAAAVAAAAAQGNQNMVPGSMDAEIGGDQPHIHSDMATVVDLVDKANDDNIDKELIGLTGS